MIIIAERKVSAKDIRKQLRRKKRNKFLLKLLYGFILLDLLVLIGYIVRQ